MHESHPTEQARPADRADQRAAAADVVSRLLRNERARRNNSKRGSALDATSQYLNEIGRIPLLKAEEEIELSKLVQASLSAKQKLAQEDAEITDEQYEALNLDIKRGEAAKQQFMRANLRLVVAIAKRYSRPTGLELLDLIQEGNLGLEHAIDLFDHTRGNKFSTYATWWIKQSITRAIDQKGTVIRLPSYLHTTLRSARKSLALNNNPDATLPEELQVLENKTQPVYLNNPIDNENDVELIDFIPSQEKGPDIITEESMEAASVISLLDILDERALRAVYLRFGIENDAEHSFKEIGKELGITAEAARRLVNRSLERMRDSRQGQKLIS